MFFTRFPINLTRRSSKAMLASPYRLHAAIAGCFPPKSPEAHTDEGRILWRIDTNQDKSSVLYIVSPQVPSLVGLDEQIGWPDLDRQWSTRDYTPMLDRIKEGQHYAFRLTANPTISRKHIVGANGHSKRVAHLTAIQHASWLVGEEAFAHSEMEAPPFMRTKPSRADRNGFSVCTDGENLQLIVSNMEKQTFRNPKSDKQITITRAQYDGILEVKDAQKLRHALCCGIGHAKGFGCGLITIVPMDA